MSSDLSTLPRARQASGPNQATGIWRPSRRRNHLPTAMAGDLLRVGDLVILVAIGLALPSLIAALVAWSGPDGRLDALRLPASFAVLLPWVVALGALLAAWLLDSFGAYKPETLTGHAPVLTRLLPAFLLVFVAMAALDGLSQRPPAGGSLPPGLPALGFWLALAFLGSSAVHLGARAFARSRLGRARLADTVVIAGTPDLVESVLQRFAAAEDGSYRLLGLFGEGLNDLYARGVASKRGDTPVLGQLDDLVGYVREQGADQVILALPWQDRGRAAALASALNGLAVDVNLVLDSRALPLNCRGVTRVGEVEMLRVADSPLRQWRGVAKRIEDYTITLAVMPLLLPLFAVIALAIRLESPGPVLFHQRRDGFNNIPITVYKFRTMRHDLCDLSGGQQTKRNDPRVTRVGNFLRKTSLDELPQLINVLRGEMSLVGPRPHPLGMRTEERLCHEIVADYAHRHRMKPGLTGWAQINGCRGAVETSEELRKRVELDLCYIENWSVLGDLRIIAMTVVTLFQQKNAF